MWEEPRAIKIMLCPWDIPWSFVEQWVIICYHYLSMTQILSKAPFDMKSLQQKSAWNPKLTKEMLSLARVKGHLGQWTRINCTKWTATWESCTALTQIMPSVIAWSSIYYIYIYIYWVRKSSLSILCIDEDISPASFVILLILLKAPMLYITHRLLVI